MSFSKNDLENIKSKLSIRSILEKKTKLIQKGKDYWCCCPFHEEKTPSCKINDDYGSFYCFGCGAKGDIFTIYTDLYNFNFVDAVKELANQAGVEINFETINKSKKENIIKEILELSCLWFQKNLNDSKADVCIKYLEKRKLTKETVDKFKLGYSFNDKLSLYNYLKNKSFKDEDILESNVVKLDKNNKIKDYFYKRLIFPIFDIQGKVIGFGGRALDNSNPKYLNSPESKIFQKRYLLYNLNLAKNYARKKNNLLICEGYMDVISLHQNGINSVVAPLGTALTENQLELAWRYSSKPTVMFDGDSAGMRAAYKTAIMTLKFISPKKFLQFINLPKDYDPDSFINKFSLVELIEKLKNPESLSKFIFEQSIKSISLSKVDEKISYDKYLDDLINTIQDKKTKYFYKNEFNSLFFNQLSKIRKKVVPKKDLRNIEVVNLINKQNLSFIATAINHPTVREKILLELVSTDLFNREQMSFIQELQNNDIINLNKSILLTKYKDSKYSKIVNDSLKEHIYQLFPYSSPKFETNQAFEELKKSLNNLNTRLLKLKKINKSLDTFISNSNQLNWSDLQNINLEILEDN